MKLVTKHGPGFVDALHLPLRVSARGRGLVGGKIGVMSTGEVQVGAADLSSPCLTAHTQDLVVGHPRMVGLTGSVSAAVPCRCGTIGCDHWTGTVVDEVVIVLVEDDPNIADLVDMYLRQGGYRVYQASDGETGLQLVHDRKPKLVILDVGLPGAMDGIDVCRELRSSSDIPIIMLTARDGEVDRVLGLEMGADDYVTKPFSPRELVARVKAILRRSDNPKHEAAAVLSVGTCEVNLGRREASVTGEVVALAAREFDLLAYLAENRGLALSRRQLLDGVWGPDWVGDERTVDVHVRQLRKKLGDALPLSTVWGVGYRLD